MRRQTTPGTRRMCQTTPKSQARIKTRPKKMWIYSATGFVSISRHRDLAGCLMIRARDRASLASLFPAADIHETPEADYRWRATVVEADAVAVIATAVARLDYSDDVKNSIGWEHQALYRDIWAVTRGHLGGA